MTRGLAPVKSEPLVEGRAETTLIVDTVCEILVA